MRVEDVAVAAAVHPDVPEVPEAAPTVIEVRELVKRFEIPTHRVDSIKERVLHPFARAETRSLLALNGISFDVRQGEFFGIVGRNGTGKSTLLKILASIYRADAGRIRMAGRLAPFIELGVGFNTELTARENVVLNGVMTGLSREEAETRLDAVLEFAELEEFVDLKLKNYSSGMLVRLAFSVMIQSDAEILLIDEVLAVGDAAFQQKCKDVFVEMRDSNRTVVLVTHDMTAVEQFCQRAMLLEGGRIEALGEPEDIARRYMRLNFDKPPAPSADGSGEGPSTADVRVVDAWLAKADGERTANVEQGDRIEVHAVFEARRDVPGPSFGITITSSEGIEVTGFGAIVDLPGSDGDHFTRGERMEVTGVLDNRLAPGRYAVGCWVHRDHTYADLVLHVPHMLDFVVYGTHHMGGVVSLLEDARVVRLEEGR